MFGLDVQKPRKLTTYGKSSRQQAFGFESFLEGSPEKGRSQASTARSRSKAASATAQDGHSAQSAGLRNATASLQHKLKPPATGTGQVKERAPTAARVRETVAQNISDEQTVQKKRKRNEKAASHEIPQSSAAKDIFDFPDDENDASVTTSVPLPIRNYGGRPVSDRTTTSSTSAASRTRSRRNTPEPPPTHQIPLATRKFQQTLDVYDIPDDDDDAGNVQTKSWPNGAITSPSTTRKRQKTPVPDAQDETKVTSRAKSRATSPSRHRPMGISVAEHIKRKNILSPKSSASNGVVKRKLTKGASAPASLFSMIREPPSPPGDSSDSVASPATPDMNSEMEVEPAMTPTTPLNRASASPATALSGSVTPRQKQLWSQLLADESTDSPGELRMSKLRLTSSAKASSQKIASVIRSASDIPRSSPNRRTRLIDTLKATAAASEADEMDVDGSSELESHAPLSNSSSDVSGAKPSKLRTEVSFKKTSAKVTYGQGRTYLEEKSEERLWDMLAAEESSRAFPGNASQTQGSLEDDIDMDGGSQLRAAHDLRAAGSRKRLHDELSMLVMDVEERANSTSIRRAALRDLAQKLLEKEAASCFFESGLDNNFLKAVEKDNDTIFLFLEAAVVVLLVSADPTSSILDHIFHSHMFSNLFKLLDLNTSLEKVVRDRKSNLAKMAQSMVLEFRDLLLTADVWGQTKPRLLTPRALGLQCIEMVVRKLREHGSSYTFLDETTVKKVLEIAQMELASPNVDIAIVEIALSALQVNTVSSSTLRHKIWPATLTKVFADILPAILALPDETASLCVHLALKLAVELTNHNTTACDTIGTPTIINTLLRNANIRYGQLLNHQVGEAYNVAFDFTVLSFGLTINLTEVSDKARLAMLEEGGEPLNEAIHLFIRGKKRAEDAESLEDTQMNVIYGCLAFTLGNLSRNPDMRKTVASQLPGGNLDLVLEAMQEFAAINQLTDKKEFDGEEGHEVSKNFTERLHTVLEEVKALNT